MANSVIKEDIYTTTVNIPKLCDNPTKVTIDAWFSLIGSHIANKGVAEDFTKTEVLEQYVGAAPGEARDVIKLGHLKELK